MQRLYQLIIFASLIFSGAARSCEYPEPEPFGHSLSSATTVFIFQIESESLEIDSNGERLAGSVVAKIRVTDVLKGKPVFTQLTFTNRWCGGNRLDVGNYFVVATSQSGKTLKLRPADQSIIDVSRKYVEGDKSATDNANVIPRIRAALNGKPLPKSFSASIDTNYTQTLPPPPPPPPSSASSYPCKY